MSDNTSDFLIRIRTALEGAGIKATDDQVKGLTEDLKDAGTKGEDAHEKITHGAHKSELGHHELKEAVHAVANQFGGLADVGLWLNPMTAALAATLFLIDKIKERLNEAKEAVRQLAEQTDKINEARMKGFAESTNAAADAMQSLAIEQEKLNTAYMQGSTAMDNRVKQYAAERDAVLKVAEAKEQAFESEMHYQVELGRISKERADAAIAEAKLRLDSQRGAADASKIQEEIEQRQQELAKAAFRARNTGDQAIRAAQAGEQPLASNLSASEQSLAEAQTGKFQSTFTNWRGSKESFNGTIAELKQRIQEQADTQEDRQAQNMPEIADRYKHDKEALEEILQTQQKYVENLRQAAELDKQKLASAKAHTEEAREQFNHDQEILRSGPDGIAALQKQLELQQKVTREVQEQHRATAEINAKTAAHEEQRRVQSGKGTAQEEADIGNWQTRLSLAHESGSDAAIDANDLISRARSIEAGMRGQRPQDRDPEQLEELKDILNRILGLQSNTSQELNSQRGQLQEQRRMIEDLEMQSRNNRYQ